jgi:hypothetical protein
MSHAKSFGTLQWRYVDSDVPQWVNGDPALVTVHCCTCFDVDPLLRRKVRLQTISDGRSCGHMASH